MTSPKQLKYWRKNVKIIYWNLFGFYLQFFYCIKNIACFQNIYFVLKNVHPILDFLTRRGKFILYFSDFHLFFCELFSAERFKKNALRPTGPSPAEPQAGPSAPSSSRTGAAAAGVRAPHAAAGLPLPRATGAPPEFRPDRKSVV